MVRGFTTNHINNKTKVGDDMSISKEISRITAEISKNKREREKLKESIKTSEGDKRQELQSDYVFLAAHIVTLEDDLQDLYDRE
jgi:hypothetical protein